MRTPPFHLRLALVAASAGLATMAHADDPSAMIAELVESYHGAGLFDGAVLVAEGRQSEGDAERERLHAQVSAESVRLAGDAESDRLRAEGLAQAETLRATGMARADAEERLLEMQGKLSPPVLFALAAKELASKLQSIDHLNVTPDLLGTTLTDFLEAGRRKLSGGERSSTRWVS